MTQTIWALTRTEYAGQCTGFSSETKWLGIFMSKPDVKTLAPYIGKYLSSDMGEAIAQVMELIDKGGILGGGGYDLNLDQIPTNTLLEAA
jgi:hypothetical protein